MAGDTPNVDPPPLTTAQNMGEGREGVTPPVLEKGWGSPGSLPTSAKFLHSIFSMDFPTTGYDSCRGVEEVNVLT